MPIRESHVQRGEQRARMLRHRVAEELATARLGAGVSRRELERRVRVGREVIRRIERADAGPMTVDNLAVIASGLGLQLAVALYPDGDPVRDRGHLALLERLRSRLGAGVKWRVEVPIPIAGDRRSADALIGELEDEVLVEAETRIADVQALERRIAAKGRDLGIERSILLVADTRHNRRVIDLHPELRTAFPVGTRSCLARLRAAQRIPGNGLVIL